MPRNRIPSYCRRQRRAHSQRGFTLLELVIFATAASLAMSGALTIYLSLSQTTAKGQAAAEGRQAAYRLAQQFRRDVASAVKAEPLAAGLADAAAPDQQSQGIRLTLADGSQVDYRAGELAESATVERLEFAAPADDEATPDQLHRRMEGYHLDEQVADCRFEFGGGSPQNISCEITPDRSIPGKSLRIEAFLGRDTHGDNP